MTTTMTLNAKLNGIELRFSEKPTEAIRQAMKDLGFRWSQKQSMWWAKQNDDRLALAKKLATATEEPKTEKATKAKKAEKAEPKTKAEPKAEKAVKLSPIGEKSTYATVGADGKYINRKGYELTATLGHRKLNLGVHKEKDNTWVVIELTTGLALAGDFEKRYLAVAAIDADLFETTYQALKGETGKKYIKAMAEHKASK